MDFKRSALEQAVAVLAQQEQEFIFFRGQALFFSSRRSIWVL